jgi:hypothetical protein
MAWAYVLNAGFASWALAAEPEAAGESSPQAWAERLEKWESKCVVSVKARQAGAVEHPRDGPWGATIADADAQSLCACVIKAIHDALTSGPSSPLGDDQILDLMRHATPACLAPAARAHLVRICPAWVVFLPNPAWPTSAPDSKRDAVCQCIETRWKALSDEAIGKIATDYARSGDEGMKENPDSPQNTRVACMRAVGVMR